MNISRTFSEQMPPKHYKICKDSAVYLQKRQCAKASKEMCMSIKRFSVETIQNRDVTETRGDQVKNTIRVLMCMINYVQLYFDIDSYKTDK